MSRYDKLFNQIVAEAGVNSEDRATVLSEIFACGGEAMFAELEKIYGVGGADNE